MHGLVGNGIPGPTDSSIDRPSSDQSSSAQPESDHRNRPIEMSPIVSTGSPFASSQHGTYLPPPRSDRSTSYRSDDSKRSHHSSKMNHNGANDQNMISLSTLLEEKIPSPPASLLDIIKRFNVEGNGDRQLLLAILAAKQAEDERLSRILETRLALLQMHASRTGLVLPTSPPSSASDVSSPLPSGMALGGGGAGAVGRDLHRTYSRARGEASTFFGACPIVNEDAPTGLSPLFSSTGSATFSPRAGEVERITLPPIFMSRPSHTSPHPSANANAYSDVRNHEPLPPIPALAPPRHDPARFSPGYASSSSRGTPPSAAVSASGAPSTSRTSSDSWKSSHDRAQAERMISPRVGGQRDHHHHDKSEDVGRFRSLSDVAARALEEERRERAWLDQSDPVRVGDKKRKASSLDRAQGQAAEVLLDRDSKRNRVTPTHEVTPSVASPRRTHGRFASDSPPFGNGSSGSGSGSGSGSASGLEMLLDAAAARGMGKGEMLFV